MSTLEELTTPLTVDEVKAAIYEAIVAFGVTTTAWQPGAVARTIIAGVAIVIAGVSALVAEIAKSAFLEYAEGAWLTLVARHVYGVERITESAGTGEVTLVNTAGGVFSGGVGDLVLLNSTTGANYRCTAAYSLGSLETITVPIEAVELGTPGTATPGQIDDFVTPLVGVTVTNAAAVVGTDEESDPALRIRCRESLGAASPNGPADAYSFFAKSATREDGTAIGVTRVSTVPDGSGGITVYVATASGGVTGTASDPSTDLGAIAKLIEENSVPLAVTETVASATALALPVTYELWVKDDVGLTEDEIKALVATRLTAFVSGQPIGGTVIDGDPGRVFASAIKAVIGATVSDDLTIKVEMSAPAADLEPTVSQAPVLGTVTGTVHLVKGSAT